MFGSVSNDDRCFASEVRFVGLVGGEIGLRGFPESDLDESCVVAQIHRVRNDLTHMLDFSRAERIKRVIDWFTVNACHDTCFIDGTSHKSRPCSTSLAERATARNKSQIGERTPPFKTVVRCESASSWAKTSGLSHAGGSLCSIISDSVSFLTSKTESLWSSGSSP